MNVKESIFYVHLTQGDHLPSSHLLERLHCSGCPLRTVPVSRTEDHQPHSADKETEALSGGKTFLSLSIWQGRDWNPGLKEHLPFTVSWGLALYPAF